MRVRVEEAEAAGGRRCCWCDLKESSTGVRVGVALETIDEEEEEEDGHTVFPPYTIFISCLRNC